MLASSTHIFGLENLDLAEEVVQEALLQALRQWPFQGLPDNPRAWLVRAARIKALDLLRRQASLCRKEQDWSSGFASGNRGGTPRNCRNQGIRRTSSLP
jgi:predicted RNA polymerase sigma factor